MKKIFNSLVIFGLGALSLTSCKKDFVKPDSQHEPIEMNDDQQIAAMVVGANETAASMTTGTGDWAPAVFWSNEGVVTADTMSNDNVNYFVRYTDAAGDDHVAETVLDKDVDQNFIYTEFIPINDTYVHVIANDVVPAPDGFSPVLMYVDRSVVDPVVGDYGSVLAWNTNSASVVSVDTANISNGGELYNIAFQGDTLQVTLEKDTDGNLVTTAHPSPDWERADILNPSDAGASGLQFLYIAEEVVTTDCEGEYDPYNSSELIDESTIGYGVFADDESFGDGQNQGNYYNTVLLPNNGSQYLLTTPGFQGAPPSLFMEVEARKVGAPDTIVAKYALPVNPTDSTLIFDVTGNQTPDGMCCVDITVNECHTLVECQDGMDAIHEDGYEAQTGQPFPATTLPSVITYFGKFVDCPEDCTVTDLNDFVQDNNYYMSVSYDCSVGTNNGPYSDVATVSASLEVVDLDEQNETVDLNVYHPTIPDSLIATVVDVPYDPNTCEIICTDVTVGCCDTKDLNIVFNTTGQQALQEWYQIVEPVEAANSEANPNCDIGFYIGYMF